MSPEAAKMASSGQSSGLGASTTVASPTLQIDAEKLATITFDDPTRKLNVLDAEVLRELGAILDRLRGLAEAGKVRAVLIRSGKAGSFIAGADIEAIAAVESPDEGEAASRLGQTLFSEIEKLPVPTVAAIDGLCLGGGTEIALACLFRILSDSQRTRIGLPEVQLGILPAWGGTTRLPRLVGLQAALEMLLTGNPISAAKARRIGFASELFPSETFDAEARAFALSTPERPPGSSRKRRGLLRRLGEETAPGRRLILMAAKRQVLSRTGGHYPAPIRILEHLRRHLGSTVSKSLKAEARSAGELIVTSVSKNLIHVFRLRERARKEAGVPEGTNAEPVMALGVVGAGVMGGGIAQLAAYNDIRVRMKDIRHEAVGSGLSHAQELFDKAVRRKKLRQPEADRRMELISGGLEYHGFKTLDVVVEAVVERMDVKRSVLREIEVVVSEQAILATNTSSLSVDEMAEALRRPERFAGLHFFNPVHKMPLVEIVRGAKTSDETVATLHRLVVVFGKVPVVCQDGTGFLVNRILGPYLNEAGWLLADGATIREVDEAAEKFGMPMGPLRLVDEIGIDIVRHAGQTLHQAFGDRLLPAPPLVSIGESERLGKKGGRGFYLYSEGAKRVVDESAYDDLGGSVPLPAQRGRRLSERDIRARLVLAMLNEAARALEDGVVECAGDVDLAMIMGTGFPPFRGGLLRFADTLHARQIVSRLEALSSRHGVRFDPAPLMVELASKDHGFYDEMGA